MSETRLRRSDPDRERHWRKMVRGQERSGESVREYCRQAGVKESAFYWWRKQLSQRSEMRKAARSSDADGSERSGESKRPRKLRRGKSATATPVGVGSPGNGASPFVPIHLLAGNSEVNVAAVEIYLGDGRMVRVGPGIDRQTLMEVLSALEVRSC